MRRVAAVIFGGILASCSRGAVSPIPSFANTAGRAQLEQRVGASGYKELYAFKGGDDAGYPYAPLIEMNGELYGTTYGGGGGLEWGTVYKVSTAGAEHVLYRFPAGKNGAHPYAGLTLLNGEFYGTTSQGGKSGSGTVFKISPSGDEHVIYSFKGGDDGQYPYGGLIAVHGELYGTTYQGGISPGWGVVFKVSPAGEESVLYRFKADKDGAHPYAGLIDQGGTLYGTTYQGGTSGSGTVFKISTSGKESVIYSFKGGKDGQYPYAPLYYYKGDFYGTTYQGGVASGWGVVFKVTPSGHESVLYRFKANEDGAHPYFSGLVELGGELYGTTYQGGASGSGTIFKISTSGAERIIYSFKGGDDGEYPYAGLFDHSGALYGTTYQGGADDEGTVFKIVP